MSEMTESPSASEIVTFAQRLAKRITEEGLSSIVNLEEKPVWSDSGPERFATWQTHIKGCVCEIYCESFVERNVDTIWFGLKTSSVGSLNDLLSLCSDPPIITHTSQLDLPSDEDYYDYMENIPSEQLYGVVYEYQEGAAWVGCYKESHGDLFANKCIDFLSRFSVINNTPVASLYEARQKALKAYQGSASSVKSVRNYYQRSADVKDYVLYRAGGKCECCFHLAPFKSLSNGRGYLESHHLTRRADGGPDDPRHMAGICPNCHRRIHFGTDGMKLNERLGRDIEKKEADIEARIPSNFGALPVVT